MSTKHWNPDQVDVIVGVAPMSGFADTGMIKLTESDDRFDAARVLGPIRLHFRHGPGDDLTRVVGQGREVHLRHRGRLGRRGEKSGDEPEHSPDDARPVVPDCGHGLSPSKIEPTATDVAPHRD